MGSSVVEIEIGEEGDHWVDGEIEHFRQEIHRPPAQPAGCRNFRALPNLRILKQGVEMKKTDSEPLTRQLEIKSKERDTKTSQRQILILSFRHFILLTKHGNQ